MSSRNASRCFLDTNTSVRSSDLSALALVEKRKETARSASSASLTPTASSTPLISASSRSRFTLPALLQICRRVPLAPSAASLTTRMRCCLTPKTLTLMTSKMWRLASCAVGVVGAGERRGGGGGVGRGAGLLAAVRPPPMKPQSGCCPPPRPPATAVRLTGLAAMLRRGAQLRLAGTTPGVPEESRALRGGGARACCLRWLREKTRAAELSAGQAQPGAARDSAAVGAVGRGHCARLRRGDPNRSPSRPGGRAEEASKSTVLR